MAADLYPLNQGAKIDNTQTLNRIKETNLVTTTTLEAANWVVDTSVTTAKVYYYTYSNTNIQANSIIEIYPNGSGNDKEKQDLAFRNAFITFRSQANGSISFYCYGEVPSIAIPVKIIIRKDMISI